MSKTPELSITLVCWQMGREVPRTLWSLSRQFQQGIADLDYEIIVVDNGSDDLPVPPDMDPKPRILRAPVPSYSPVGAMNTAIANASGGLIGAWIDGARLAAPNLLKTVIDAARLHSNPVLAVPNWQLGPVRQAISVGNGYSAEVEDGLLAQAGWPSSDIDLFSISAPEAASITAPMLESNALFLSAADWDRLGGFDPAFSEPGGGAANPDVFWRAAHLPDSQLIRLNGVGTFHQIHGGVTTDGPVKAVNALKQAARNYARIRGHPMKPVRDVGWIFDAATGKIE